MAIYIHRSLKFGPFITCICLITKSLNVIMSNDIMSFRFRGYMNGQGANFKLL